MDSRFQICFCATHVKSKIGGIPKKGELYKCKKCGYDVQETKMLSMSTRTHDYGRMTRDEAESNYYGNYRFEDLSTETSNLQLEESESDEESDEESDTETEEDDE